MEKTTLTSGYIRQNKDISNVHLNISLDDVKTTKEKPYLLIIQSSSEMCTRLTIYPISQDKVIKMFLSGANVSDKTIENLSKMLQKFEVIHTSGLLLKEKQLIYECYLKLSLNDMKYKDLKASLDKIRNVFNEIKIEEIGLKNT